VAVQRFPQLELLARASVMITNGGLGTIKECLWLGVPMVVAPCDYDQPSNAARVVFHGLGTRVRVRTVTCDELTRAIERAAFDPAIRAACGRIQDEVRSPDEPAALVRWLLEGDDADARRA
jgi:UDP:flavonoid glycosyltransferase YjiC (YdhE family)